LPKNLESSLVEDAVPERTLRAAPGGARALRDVRTESGVPRGDEGNLLRAEAIERVDELIELAPVLVRDGARAAREALSEGREVIALGRPKLRRTRDRSEVGNLELGEDRLACVAKARVVKPPHEGRVQQGEQGIRGPRLALEAGEQRVAEREAIGQRGDGVARGLPDEQAHGAELLGRAEAGAERGAVDVEARRREPKLVDVPTLANRCLEPARRDARHGEVSGELPVRLDAPLPEELGG